MILINYSENTVSFIIKLKRFYMVFQLIFRFTSKTYFLILNTIYFLKFLCCIFLYENDKKNVNSNNNKPTTIKVIILYGKYAFNCNEKKIIIGK